MIYFTADPHYDHENIIELQSRPFTKLNLMNTTMIKRYNGIVKPEDVVYFVGDFSLRSARYRNWYMDILRRLNGKKILVLGNHDDLKPFTYVECGFYSVHTHMEIEIDGIPLVLIHDPAASCVDRNKVFIVGHIHDLFKVHKNVINVGVEVWDFAPVSWDQIKELIEKEVKPWQEEQSIKQTV